jgi:hypothetical protein
MRPDYRFGVLTGPILGPYVYVLAVRSFVYIGETQSLPLYRWRAHLEPDGTFTRLLREHDADELLQRHVLRFGCFPCAEIVHDVPVHERRRATQWVEHELHLRFAESGVLSGRFSVISNTTRTAPRRYTAPPGVTRSFEAAYSHFFSFLTAEPQ